MKQNKSRFTKYSIKNEAGQDVEVIRNLLLTDVKLNWVYVVTPDDEERFRADAVIEDPNDVALIQEYLEYAIEKARVEKWGGSVPSGAFYPVREVNEESEIEKGGILTIKTKASLKNRPLLYIRDSLDTDPREVVTKTTILEEVPTKDLKEFYSGMVADIIISASGYAPEKKGHASGITFWLNAVCKTGVGTPYAPIIDEETEYADMFSAGGESTKGMFTPKTVSSSTPLENILANKQAATAPQEEATPTVNPLKDLVQPKAQKPKEEPTDKPKVFNINDLIK